MDPATILSPNVIRYESVIWCDVHRDNVVCYSLQRALDGNWLQSKEVFSTTQKGLTEYVEWCNNHEPQKILMESTGIYWMPPYDALERAGLPISIVNPCHVKRMDGKKTDMEDACWLAKVAVNGSFTPSYIPPLEYRHLRLECRNAVKMIENLTSQKNRETKLFKTAGYNLSIFSDQFGKAAMVAKQAILDGKSAEEITNTVRAFCSKKIKATRATMLEAFNGNMTDTIKRTILAVREVYNKLESLIADEKQFLIAKVKELEPKNFMLLQTIPGISEWAATIILIEIGGGESFLQAFANSDRFAAWTGLCPGNNQSANKRTGNKRRKGNKNLRRAFCEAAQAATKTKGTTFQSKYHSLVIRLGTKKSIVAIAHKILDMVYYVLSHQVGYVDPKIDYQKMSCKKNAARWIKQLSLLDDIEITAVYTSTGEVISSKEIKDKERK